MKIIKMKDFNKLISLNIKHYRYKNNLTINKLSELTNININKLLTIENNKKDINIYELFKISKVLNINIEDLFKFENINNTIITFNNNFYLIKDNKDIINKINKYIDYINNKLKLTDIEKILIISNSLNKQTINTINNIKDISNNDIEAIFKQYYKQNNFNELINSINKKSI